jgi:hypothetical protein
MAIAYLRPISYREDMTASTTENTRTDFKWIVRRDIKTAFVVIIAIVVLIQFLDRYQFINDSGPGIYVINRWTGTMLHVRDDGWTTLGEYQGESK